jgi:transposase InsO family protein
VDSQGNIAQLPYDLIEKLVKSNAIQGIQMKPENQNREMIQKILASANEQDYRTANERQEALDRLSRGEDVDVPSRTLRSWRSRYKEAEILMGMGYLGLLPRDKERGNHNPRMEEEIKKLMLEHIDLDYLNVKQKKIALSYGSFCTKCEAKGYPIPPSYKTYGKAIQQVDIERRKRRREGSKAAYQYQLPYLYLEFTTPRHGDRVFEVGHIDHTQLDIELVDSRSGKELGKPWLTFLMDAFSRRVLAMYLTFDPPSYRSCMMVLRECVRRHARLPKTIVVDGGKEFHSIYFDTFLAMYECTKKVRPPAQARFGAVIERLFGKTNTQFLYALLGNTQASKKHRQMTKETNPKKHAAWTLKALNEQLGNYVYEVYDQLEHPTLGMKPGGAFQQSISLSGMRESQFIAYNDDFIMMTLPTTKKGTALVGVNGVKINNIYYNNIALRRLINKQLPIRYDPFDMGVAYVYAQKHWIKCISQYYAIFKGRTEKEIKLITDEIKAKNKNNSKNFSINAKTLARFITNVENEQWILQQRRKDLEGQETRNIYDENVPIAEEEDDLYEDDDSDLEEEIVGNNEFEGYGEF